MTRIVLVQGNAFTGLSVPGTCQRPVKATESELSGPIANH